MIDSALDRVAELAAEAARAGGAVLREAYGRVHSVRFKGEIDLVTEVDLRAERTITDLIRSRFPDHRILAEEGTIGGDDAAHRWLIDPLDGTTNYAHGVPVFCVSVGYELEGQMAVGAIYDPSRDELFIARAGRGATANGQPLAVSTQVELGRALLATGFPYNRVLLPRALDQFNTLSRRTQAVRRIGSAALDLAWVAAARMDGFWEDDLDLWDTAAGMLLVKEAGGFVSDFRGQDRMTDRREYLAANGDLHSRLHKLLAGALRQA